MKVVVVGAGPAGSSAAITARQFGAEVVLLEASAFPRFRPGESLHPGIAPLVDQLDPAGRCFRSSHLRYHGYWVAWGSRPEYVRFGGDANGPWTGYQVLRSQFDAGLVEAARAIGVDVRLGSVARRPVLSGERVIGLQTASGNQLADVVIDATGGRCWLGRALGLARTAHSPRLVARFAYAHGDAGERLLPRLSADSLGWTWVADLGGGRYHWTRVTEPHGRMPRDWVPPECQGMRIAQTGAADVTWRLAERLAGPGWFLCGESAAVLDPASAHGVLRGIMSGRMAAGLAVPGGGRDSTAARLYHEWLTEWFHNDADHLRRAYREARLFQDERAGA